MNRGVCLRVSIALLSLPITMNQMIPRGFPPTSPRQFSSVPFSGGFTPIRVPLSMASQMAVRQRPLIGITGGGLAPLPVNPVNAFGDLLFTTTMGLPLMGLMALSGLVLLPFFGVNLGAISLGSLATTATGAKKKNTKKYGKSRRLDQSLEEIELNAAKLMVYLEKIFVDHSIRSPACKNRAVCEYSCQKKHHMPLGDIATDIDLIFKKRRELEKTEPLPISQFLFLTYLNAEEKGRLECGQCLRSYMACPRSPLDSESTTTESNYSDPEDKNDPLSTKSRSRDEENEIEDSNTSDVVEEQLLSSET